MAKKRIYLKDIAEESGFTINTVSRALHNKKVISEPTRKKIQKIAAEMGYVPDALATSLRNGNSKTIGIVFDHLINPYYMIMTDLIHEFIKEAGYEVMIFTSTNRNTMFEKDGFTKMISRRIDGIISYLKPTIDVVDSINATGIPTIIFGRDCTDITLDFINTDDFHGGYLMGEYFAKAGYKHVAYIGGPKEIDCSINRYRGLKESLKNTVNPLDENLVRYTDNSFSSLENHVKHMVDNNADAILCYNDYMAFEVMNYLSKMNLNVPEDIAIAGYDDLQETLKMPTKLTTIGTNKNILVKNVVDLLFKKIENASTELKQETLPVYLVKGTTA
ncbi:MAG: LacI family DNA-binding transcriptional regulator [Bacillota bacterium]